MECLECTMKTFEIREHLYAIVNCLNFGHPKDSLNDFSYTIDILTDACKRLNIPVVGEM